MSLVSFDTETFLFVAGCAAPSVVCSSTARLVDGRPVGDLIVGATPSRDLFLSLLESKAKIAFANAPYDLLAMAELDPSLFKAIFDAAREGRIYDVLIGEALNAIYHGHLGTMPDGSPLVNDKGKVTDRYSLALSVRLTLGRSDAKENDLWRLSYGLLDGVPVEKWPRSARIYPIDDAVNTVEDAKAQIDGQPGRHEWEEVPSLPGDVEFIRAETCRYCGLIDECPDDPFALGGRSGPALSYEIKYGVCLKAPRREPHANAQNHAFQVEADLALKLGAAWGLRTDPERVQTLAAEVEEKHKKAVERFQKKGWIRADGTEDQSAVKRAVAVAYGASVPCLRCGGERACSSCGGTGQKKRGPCGDCYGSGKVVGRVQKIEVEECRGEKVRGRYRGCPGAGCAVCSGTRLVSKVAGDVTCKSTEEEEGCDGTGFDLSGLTHLPRTDKGGVSTDRDTKSESGDEDLADFGDDEFEKSRNTYVPYLRTGIDRPLTYRPNVLVATGRCSYEGSPLHQMPRKGKERGCIRARGAWCESPVEFIFGATDYEAGELCSLAQLTYWLFGYSQMREAINVSKRPGILHSDLAAEVLGISLDEFLKRLKDGDKQAKDFRQMTKSINFGRPGLMGDAKLILTNRKKNAGFTVSERGPAVSDGKSGYWGVRFCILAGEAEQCGVRKVTEWKRRPCPPVCEACLKVVDGVLSPAYFRRYPEIRDYFKWAQKRIDRGEPAPVAVWDPNENAPKIVRERGGCDAPAYCNNGFQGLLAEVGKYAIIRITRECYLGVKEDGSPSPLAGCRMPIFLHDEPLTELIAETAHLSGPRVAEIMMESGRTLAPDVTWKAESALAYYWNKNMEPTYLDGKLVPWIPNDKR